MPDDPLPDGAAGDSTSESETGENTPLSEEGKAGGSGSSVPGGDHPSVPWWARDGNVPPHSEDWSPGPEAGSPEEDPTPQPLLPPDAPSPEENREPPTPSTGESRQPATPLPEESREPATPTAGERPAATSPLRVVKQTGHPRKRLSPILIPGEPTSSTPGRMRRWMGELLEGRKTPDTSRSARAPGTSRGAPGAGTRDPAREPGATKPLASEGAAPEEAPSSLLDTEQPDSVAPRSAHDQPVHRATTQLLPGRLQPINPEVIEQEIRFLKARTPRETQVVTLGWNLGDLPEHVTLDHPSIKPLHARMIYQKSHWMIESLTDADPVEINGTLLLAGGVPYLLSSGDQIRIGKALFRFLLS